MKKWILIVGGLGALVAGAAAALLVSINPIVEAGVNKFGPDITGTHVFLKKADISVFSGEGSLHEFTLGNPKGYTAPHAVKVGSVSVALDKDSLLEDVIVIKKIAIDSPDIIYEIGKKSNNFDDIIKNVEQLGAARDKAAAQKQKEAAKSGADAKEEGAAKKVVIDELVITNGKYLFPAVYSRLHSHTAWRKDSAHIPEKGCGQLPAERQRQRFPVSRILWGNPGLLRKNVQYGFGQPRWLRRKWQKI